MQDQCFISPQSEFTTHRFARTLRWTRFKKVVNDFDWAVEIQKPVGFIFQESRDRSHGIGTIQRMPNGRTIARVLAQERSVRTCNVVTTLAGLFAGSISRARMAAVACGTA